MSKLWWCLAVSFLAATSVDEARDGGEGAAVGTSVTVEVTGLASSRGAVECVLWASAEGFPTDPARALARVRVRGLQGPGARCTFEGVPRGTFAVTMSHDENENGQVDRNFLGIPVERYGFSNNPRPFLRAPRFEEATFVVAGTPLLLQLVAE